MFGVDDTLKMVAITALSFSKIDMSVPWRGGKRTAEEQNELFQAGNSRCDGFRLKSFHQSGQALDLVPYVNGKIDYTATEQFIKFAKLMLETFEFLQAIGKVPKDIHLHWGGFWSATDNNNDGILTAIDDKSGWDKPHWELRDYPQKNKLLLI
jgi:peptidoglycan L-alanyl-D-glutamate endopeptidase CwlK